MRLRVDISGAAIDVEHGTPRRGGNIVLAVQNVYDEVLSEEAQIRAVLILRLREFPDSSRTLVLDGSDITTPGFLTGRTLTLTLGDTMMLMRPWDHRTDGGKPFWELGVHFTQKLTDKGVPYFESDPVRLTVVASLQVFKKVQTRMLPPAEFTITYFLWNTLPPG